MVEQGSSSAGKIDKSIFRAYDIRGTYPDQFNEDIAYRIVRAYAQKLKPKTTVVGRDMRLSGPALIESVIRALVDAGSDVISIDMTTTPMYYYAVNALGADAGVSVTASHDPEQYNGLKLTGPKAVPSVEFVSDDDLYLLASAGDFEKPSSSGNVREAGDLLASYVEAVKKTSGLEDFGGLKLVVDAGNGMDGVVLPALFHDTNCVVTPLYWTPDGRFPNHEANPLKEETLKDLKQKVLETGANLGVAYDGDGDRVGFVDETGCHIPGDIMTAIIAREMLKAKPGATIIYDLRSSRAVAEEIEKAGGKPLMYKVGHGLIKPKMAEVGAFFAGELSCHYYFSDFYTTDNGDLAMLRVMRAILTEGKPLSEMAMPIMRYSHSLEMNSTVPDVPGKMDQLKEIYKDGRQIQLDGLTVDYDDWWFNVRPSQTEPLLRLNVEADSRDKMIAKAQELLTVIRGKPGEVEEIAPPLCWQDSAPSPKPPGASR